MAAPKWFYDARGSELFEEITRLPEYYPTRAERAVLAERAATIAELTGAKTLIELGSGSSEKTRLLLDAFTRRGGLGTFVPLDVSVSALRQSTAEIAADYPGLRVRGIVGDFTRHLDRLPTGGRRLVLFLGGTIGNLLPVERARFLAAMRAALEPGDWLLIGTDLVKDPAVVVPAYDDSAGVTAEFNRNVLRVVNRELGADFDPRGSPTSRSGTPSGSGSRCGCGRGGRCAYGCWTWRSPSPRARSCARRCRRSSGRRGSPPNWARPASPPTTSGPIRPASSASPWPAPIDRWAAPGDRRGRRRVSIFTRRSRPDR